MHYCSIFSGTTEPDMMKLCKLRVLKVNEILKHFGVGWVTLPNSDLQKYALMSEKNEQTPSEKVKAASLPNEAILVQKRRFDLIALPV